MSRFVQSLANAQQSVADVDIRDVSSLAYVSALVALEAILPVDNPAEMDFAVSIVEKDRLRIDIGDMEVEDAVRDAINVVASHYFQARRYNLSLSVH